MFYGDMESPNLLLSKVNVLFSWILIEHDRMTFTFNFPSILKAAPQRHLLESKYLEGPDAVSFITGFLEPTFCNSIAKGHYSMNVGLLNERSESNG